MFSYNFAMTYWVKVEIHMAHLWAVTLDDNTIPALDGSKLFQNVIWDPENCNDRGLEIISNRAYQDVSYITFWYIITVAVLLNILII